MAKAPSANPRALWKGAISFGLVHVPVSLHTATQEQDIDFDWLDERSMDPVGYKRVNKRTGKEIAKEHIVKGVRLEGSDDYVVIVLARDIEDFERIHRTELSRLPRVARLESSFALREVVNRAVPPSVFGKTARSAQRRRRAEA